MSISKVGTYAFYNHPNLERAVVSAPTIEANAFQNAKKLEVADLTSTAADTINAGAFSGCSNLTHLIVRSTARSLLPATSAFDGTKIKFGDGGIYVPADLLDSYKGAPNWSAFADNIYPIGEYPKANFDTINDDWSTILTNPSYFNDYNVGDTKIMELTDGTKIKMMLVGKNVDNKTDKTGKTKQSWMSVNVIFVPTMLYTVSTYDGGWPNWEIRNYLNSVFLNQIPLEIRNHIVSVIKTSTTYFPDKVKTIITSNDYVWLPSYSEVNLSRWDTYKSDDDVVYSAVFKDSNSRIKYTSNFSTEQWPLRNQGSTKYYIRTIDSNGNDINNSVNMNADVVAIVFGFCTD